MSEENENELSEENEATRITRRRFNQVLGVGIAVSAEASWGAFATYPDAAQGAAGDAAEPAPGNAMDVGFTVNGERRELTLDTRTTLLDALREHLGLTGTKKGCDHGQCGACTAIVDGRRMNTCLSLAVMHEGSEITTIEGLGTLDDLHPMQAAFVEHDGYQCGYCTPGQILSAVATLREIDAGVPSAASVDVTVAPRAAPEEIRERMSGNLCRCAAYPNIVAAIVDVQDGRG